LNPSLFSSSSFKISDLILLSCIHFEFIFMQGDRRM
jgi:hypothetical protein